MMRHRRLRTHRAADFAIEIQAAREHLAPNRRRPVQSAIAVKSDAQSAKQRQGQRAIETHDPGVEPRLAVPVNRALPALLWRTGFLEVAANLPVVPGAEYSVFARLIRCCR